MAEATALEAVKKSGTAVGRTVLPSAPVLFHVQFEAADSLQ
jgi:hypothetical protein